MELKRISARYCSSDKPLLIVPYGIETVDGFDEIDGRVLLIVPYGIETDACISDLHHSTLLIVPYGIETS